MRSLSFLCVLALAGCAAADEVAFASAAGSAAGTGPCHCSYDDGSHGDAFLQISCNPGLGAVSLFLDPSAPGPEQAVSLLFLPDTAVGTFRAGGKGQFKKLGPARREKPNAPKIIHDLDGVELRWDEQDTCDVAYGCDTKFHLPAGSLTGGQGGCEDFWATVDQN